MKPSTVWAPRIRSVLRIMLGLILLQYGLAKLFGWPAVRIFKDLEWLSLYGVLGLYTRPVAFILSGEMAAAYFIEHFPVSFFPVLSQGDLAVTMCFALLYL